MLVKEFIEYKNKYKKNKLNFYKEKELFCVEFWINNKRYASGILFEKFNDEELLSDFLKAIKNTISKYGNYKLRYYP